MDFDCIYKSYYLDVYHFLCGLSSNKEIAEDITQETFTKALTAINSYDGRKDIRAWLFTIARNTYFTYCKREKIYVEWEPPTEQVDIQTEFIDNLINKEQVEKIHNFLKNMKDPYKIVFELRIHGELSFEKIGRIFGKSKKRHGGRAAQLYSREVGGRLPHQGGDGARDRRGLRHLRGSAKQQRHLSRL